MIIPREYIVQKYYQYAGFPKYKKIANIYEGSCPICREGKSWGKKKRSYYLVEDNTICCHNCGWFGKPFNWIKQVSGMTDREIYDEIKNYDVLPIDLAESDGLVLKKEQYVIPTLPVDSINLFDKNQITYYSDSEVVRDAINYVKRRKLDVAVNRPDTLWLSLTDKVHKNRIVIPFYNSAGDIIHYQSRALYERDTKNRPKYLSKVGSERALSNLNKITPDLDYIFIFEGPIDSFFVKNGTCVAGIQEHSNKNFTALQQDQLAGFRMYKKIWVLDSQWLDTASKNKSKRLLDTDECVFIWPKEIGKKFKDINDLCIAANRNYIDPNFFIKNSFTGIKGQLALSQISH